MTNETELPQEIPGAQTLRRGLSILKLLAQHPLNGLGVSEIARRLGLKKATAVRLTRTLLEEQFIAQDVATRHYRLGPESFAVGLAAEPNYMLQRNAAPYLRSLALETGNWVFFSVRQGLECICLSRASGDVPFPQASLRVGDRHPLGLGAGGLAILASMPLDEAESAIINNAPKIALNYPIMTIDKVREMLLETRERGYSVIPGNLSPGYWGIGVPVLRAEGKPVAAIVLIESTAKMSAARQTAIAARLQRISEQLEPAPSHEELLPGDWNAE